MTKRHLFNEIPYLRLQNYLNSPHTNDFSSAWSLLSNHRLETIVFGEKNCHRISNECSKETLRMESQVGWLWELFIISLRIKMLLCNSIVGVSNPFFFIQLPYFYSLNSFFPNLSSPVVLC